MIKEALYNEETRRKNQGFHSEREALLLKGAREGGGARLEVPIVEMIDQEVNPNLKGS